jgi:hypothetical protein
MLPRIELQMGLSPGGLVTENRDSSTYIERPLLKS